MSPDLDTFARGRSARDAMIYVYRLPDELARGFCHGAPVSVPFGNVDWFNALPPEGSDYPRPDRSMIAAEIKRKRYYDPSARFLVLSDIEGESFVIEAEPSHV